jgi:hypothetical protein
MSLCVSFHDTFDHVHAWTRIALELLFEALKLGRESVANVAKDTANAGNALQGKAEENTEIRSTDTFVDAKDKVSGT